MRCTSGHLRSADGGHAARIAGEFLAARTVIKQKQTLALDHPDIGIAGDRKPARHPDRIVAAILRHVDIRRGGERGAIADIGEAPDHVALAQFQVRAAQHRLAVGEKGHRIIAVDGEAGMPVDHDPLARRSPRSCREQEGQTGIGQEPGNGREAEAVTLSLLPCCRHSLGKRWGDSDRFTPELSSVA